MMRDDFVTMVENTADAARSAGQTIDINYRIPYVGVTTGQDEYFFQGQEAQELLDGVPRDLSEEDYILFLAQGW